MNRSKLAKSISLLLTAGTLTVAGTSNAFASATYYNTNKPIDAAPIVVDGISYEEHYTDTGALGTDGWIKSDNSGNSGTVLPWLGTTGGVRPFDYVGKMPANWAAKITAVGDSLEISQADAALRYGSTWGPYEETLVNIDTAKGAWSDGYQGWGHNTDIGLFKSDVTALVTLNLTTLFNDSEPDKSWSNFGVTVFTGMDTGNAGYSHHYDWNCPTCASPQLFTKSNPGGSDGVIYDGSIGVSIPGQAYSANVDDTTGFTFLAQADQVYSIYLGGNSGEGQFDPHAGYKLDITTAPVPVPGAVWLFGSALVGLIGLRRHRPQNA